MTAGQSRKAKAVTLCAVGAALLPAARLARILATTGANVPSSDDIFFLPATLGKMLAGGYHWIDLPRDSFQNTHVTVFPALAYLLMARFGHFNIYYALFFGVAVATAKLALLYDAFTRASGSDGYMGKAVLLVLLSAMIFSVTQISVFEHDFQSLKTSFLELGLAAGVWALARYGDRWGAILVVCAGGILASFSFANGIFLWPIFLVTLWVTGSRRISRYLAVCATAGVALAPYTLFLVVERLPGIQSRLVALMNVRFVLSELGRAFSNNIGFRFLPSTGEIAIGAVGICVFAGLLTLLLRGSGGLELLRRAIPALSLSAFGLLSILQISMYRNLIAPWYTTFAMDFWIGAVGLAYLLWSKGTRTLSLNRVTALVSAVVVGILFLSSNRTYSDKSFFLRTRAPASAASLRNYLTAPTYAADTLEIWRPSDPLDLSRLGSMLDRFNLSVFGPHQEWTLQGDWILDNVTFTGADVGWSQGLTPPFTSFTDFRHLNLLLGGGDSVSWSVALPSDTLRATFDSAAALSGPMGTPGPGGKIEVTVSEDGGEERILYSVSPKSSGEWNKFSFQLGQYAGRKVTLNLRYMAPDGNSARAAFRYPCIQLDVREAAGGNEWRAPSTAPSNTDLSPGFLAPGSGDLIMNPNDPSHWTSHDMSAGSQTGEERRWRVDGSLPWLEYSEPLDLDLTRYRTFFIMMQGCTEQLGGHSYTGDLYPSAISVDVKTAEQPIFETAFVMPIIRDGSQHSYTYPLWKFGISGRITGLRLVPEFGLYQGSPVARIAEVGFISRVHSP